MMVPGVRGGALEIREVVLFHAATARVFNTTQMPFGVSRLLQATRMASEVEGVVPRARRADWLEIW